MACVAAAVPRRDRSGLRIEHVLPAVPAPLDEVTAA
jgi:hypothetical protein